MKRKIAGRRNPRRRRSARHRLRARRRHQGARFQRREGRAPRSSRPLSSAKRKQALISFGLAAALKRQIESGESVRRRDPHERRDRGSGEAGQGGRRFARVPGALGGGHRHQERRTASRHRHARRLQAHAAFDEIDLLGEGRQSGIYFAGLLERIGIAEQMKPKVVPAATGTEVGKLVASGQVELGVILVNELMAAPGVEVLGPLPPELQNYTVFHAGVGVGSKDSSAAKALIKFLTTPSAGAVFKARGRSRLKRERDPDDTLGREVER